MKTTLFRYDIAIPAWAVGGVLAFCGYLTLALFATTAVARARPERARRSYLIIWGIPILGAVYALRSARVRMNPPPL